MITLVRRFAGRAASRQFNERVVGGRAKQEAVALKLDVDDLGDFEPLCENIQSAPGIWGVERFDYLVNNAGNNHHQTTAEELDSLYHVHFKGVYFLPQKLLPLINDGGRIVKHFHRVEPSRGSRQ